MKMMNKEKCEKALNEIEELYYNSDNSFGAMKQFKKDIEVLNILITDHFENKPLEFEELKEGMWVWDNVLKEYIHILTIDFGVPSDGLIETENEYVPFEQNRFYRKQVEE